MNEIEKSLEEMKHEIEGIEEEETDMAKEGVNIQHEVEKYDGILKENRSKLKHWKKEVRDSDFARFTVIFFCCLGSFFFWV